LTPPFSLLSLFLILERSITLDTITTMATTEHTEQLHEKHNGMNGNYDPEAQRMDALKQFRSAASVQMSPELFEKLYLSPMNEVKGNLRQTFGNPTPMYAHRAPIMASSH
jgi:uncharacterized protein YcbK (DUF882 family)